MEHEVEAIKQREAEATKKREAMTETERWGDYEAWAADLSADEQFLAIIYALEGLLDSKWETREEFVFAVRTLERIVARFTSKYSKARVVAKVTLRKLEVK